MLDNPLIILIRTSLLAGLKNRGYDDINVWQSYQPTQQGTSSDKTLYIHKITNGNHGFAGNQEIYDEQNEVIKRITTEILTPTYQVSSTVVYDENEPFAMTAGDLVYLAFSVMQSTEFQNLLLAQDVNIFRAGSIKNITVPSDKAGHEDRPTFDIQITHKNIYTTEVPVVKSVHHRTSRI